MLFKNNFLRISIVAAVCLHVAHAGTIDLYYLRQQETQLEKSFAIKSIQSSTFNQYIDHAQPSKGVFGQRYFIDTSYSSSMNDPVFFYICGESTCSPSALNGAIRQYAKQYHAKLVALEHRYYGQSIPFNTLTAETMEYLTIDNALKDLSRFQSYMQTSEHWVGPWVAFGGSYPGSLSAYYRLKYPNKVVGALASSAPVKAQEDFADYDAHVTQVAGEACASRMRQAVQTVERALSSDSELTQIKHLFKADAIRDKDDVLSLLAEIGAGAVQYGMRDDFCELLSSSDSPLEGYAKAADMVYQRFGVSAVELVAQGAESDASSDYSNGIGLRQWFYQSCTEYGYWQTANENPALSTRSSRINLNYYRTMCQRLFGLETPAHMTETNQAYYYPLFNAGTTSIFFTNGANDPWSRLSLTPGNGNATNLNLDYQTIQGAAHCDDLRSPKVTDSTALKQARLHMGELLEQWLTP